MKRKTESWPEDLKLAFKKLQAFNDSDEIAHYFKLLDIKGDPGIVSSCPIAMYIWYNCDDQLYDVMVNDSSISFLFADEKDDAGNSPYHEISCTSAMSSFIGLFDNHCYKELEKNYGKDG